MLLRRIYARSKLKVEQLGSSSAHAGTAQVADLNALRAEMEKLNDTLAMTSRRMERTLEITSDTEFSFCDWRSVFKLS